MTKRTITVIVSVAWNLDCTHKQPLAGKSRNSICKNSALPSCSLQKNHVCRESSATPLISLLPLYSCASGSLTSTSAIHSSFNGYSCKLHVCWCCDLPFMPSLSSAHVRHLPHTLADDEQWVSLWIVRTLKHENVLPLGTFIYGLLCTNLAANSSTTVLAFGKDIQKLSSMHWPVQT